MTFVEVSGTWLANAGADLMLRATREAMAQRAPELRLAIDPRWGSYTKRCAHGLYQVVPASTVARRVANRLAREDGWMGARVSGITRNYGIVSEAGTVGLLDISGYAFGDKWGADHALERVFRAERHHKRGAPVIFLPQSVGPLERSDVRVAFRRAAEAATMFCVRDAASWEAALAAAPDLETRLRLMPDLTMAMLGETGSGESALFLVPNGRVVDAETGSLRRAEYLALLERCGLWARDRGLPVVVITHAADDLDVDLAEELASALNVAPEVVADARLFKSRIGPTSVVVGSRFHALLAGLCRGAGCIAVGWAPKYVEVMAKFGQGRFVLDPSRGAEVTSVLDDVAAVMSSGDLERRAAEVVGVANQELMVMWDEVMDVMRGG